MRPLTAAAIALLVLGMAALPAQATLCADPDPAPLLAAGELAFIGTVGSLRSNDRWATFQVHEVWSSEELPRIVEVRGSRGDEGFLGIFESVSSADRYFEDGVTYLVFPTMEGGVLFDHNCTPTQEWSSELAGLRPASAHPPSPSSESGAGPLWPVAVAGLAVLAGVAVMFWRRRPRGSGGEATPA